MNSLSSVVYGSFFNYSPRGASDISERSRKNRDAIKYGRNPSVYDVAARLLTEELQDRSCPLHKIFSPNLTLVPAPGHAQFDSNSLCPPFELCKAFQQKGLGKTIQVLDRKYPIKKSAGAAPGERPTPAQHFASLEVFRDIELSNRIVVVDDFITKGATLLACVNAISAIYPNAEVSAFAFIRTLGLVSEIERIKEPIIGNISVTRNGASNRQP